MPKFFVISDVHGYYDEMIKALNEAGFDPQNENHWLVTCGDHFDRGNQAAQVMEYLQNLPRKVLIKGNHESLLMDCIDRQHTQSHDWHNGTAQTILELAPNTNTFEVACAVVYDKVKDFFAGMVDYLELKNHILVHSFVPLYRNENAPAYYDRNWMFEKMADWRNASDKEWEEARWGNPYALAEMGLLPDKTLVFGHYHTSWPRNRYEGRPEWGEDADFSIYRGDGYIAIDACCAHSGKINCLVIEDDFLGVEV